MGTVRDTSVVRPQTDNLGLHVPVVDTNGLLLAHDGRVGFLREAGTHTPLCVAAISGAMLRGTFHWPVLGRPPKHVPTLVLSFASTITTNSCLPHLDMNSRRL